LQGIDEIEQLTNPFGLGLCARRCGSLNYDLSDVGSTVPMLFQRPSKTLGSVKPTNATLAARAGRPFYKYDEGWVSITTSSVSIQIRVLDYRLLSEVVAPSY